MNDSQPASERARSPGPPTPAPFASTHWSVVLRAGAPTDAPGRDEALNALCRAYWPPLYFYVRRRGQDPAAAQDLVQEFFARLLAQRSLQRAEPAKGRFRTFLLTSLQRLLINEWREASAQKRGGGAVMFPIDAVDYERAYQAELTDADTPEVLYERRWARTVLDRVLDRLAAEYRDHPIGFDRLRPFLVEARGTTPFAAAAAGAGLTESAFKALVHRVRQRYGQLLRQEIADTVEDPAEVEAEIRHLISSLG